LSISGLFSLDISGFFVSEKVYLQTEIMQPRSNHLHKPRYLDWVNYRSSSNDSDETKHFDMVSLESDFKEGDKVNVHTLRPSLAGGEVPILNRSIEAEMVLKNNVDQVLFSQSNPSLIAIKYGDEPKVDLYEIDFNLNEENFFFSFKQSIYVDTQDLLQVYNKEDKLILIHTSNIDKLTKQNLVFYNVTKSGLIITEKEVPRIFSSQLIDERLLTSHNDGTVRLWSLSGEELLRLDFDSAYIPSALFPLHAGYSARKTWDIVATDRDSVIVYGGSLGNITEDD
jgi:hypothetical protein